MINTINLDWLPSRGIFARPRFRTTVATMVNGHLVPAGFVTDGASIPRPVMAYLSAFGPYFPAALLHDYLLTQEEVTRKMAAVKFKKALKALNMPWWLYNTFYTLVRLNDHWHGLRRIF